MAGLEGQKIGDCEIIAKLGQGGMGAVYKARQPELDRLVAVKFLPRDWSDDSDFVARFKREAASAARLNHPNMVQVYTAGKHEDTYYFVMEFVDGEDVQQRLDRKGRLHPAEAVTIALCVAQALDYGWKRAKLIHRDIKPDNIYLSNNGEVKLGDLGLAKSVSSTLTGLTPFGGSMGTPHFVSPEQARGNRDVDFRADIYSLGCTLYYMLTGQLPYGRDGDALAIVHKHVYEPPPAILKVWPDCPPALAALVTRMVEKKPEDRYQNYDEVTAEMQCILDSLPPVPSAAVTDVPSVSARSSAVRHVPTLPAESVAGHPRFPPVAVGGGTGVKFLQDQINGARDGVSLV
ncbi:MAG: serine/threonine protein kinase, partial [Verrucomicrobia bacterium]|nr:serine/threonine protein kinase [Verrucomicrobiota bacterium]